MPVSPYCITFLGSGSIDSGPFVVVSDVHIGSSDSNCKAFCHFCAWLEQLEKEGSKTIEVVDEQGRKCEQLLSAPETLILLGDILELWDPQDNTAVLQHSFPILDRLSALKCKKVYVLGNHDEDLSEYSSDKEALKTQDPCSYAPRTYRFKNGSVLVIVDGQYPNYHQKKLNQLSGQLQYSKMRKEIGKKEWKEVQGKRYVFLHGHQFDKMFERVGPLRRVPGIMRAAADFYDRRSKWIGPLSFFSFLVLLTLIATNWINALAAGIEQMLPVLWIFLVICAFPGIPWLWVKIQKPAWKHLFRHFSKRPTYEDIGTIIDNRYYNCDKDFTDPNSIIVFGHTHVPDFAIVPKRNIKAFWKTRSDSTGTKTFVNCGAWVKPDKDEGANVTSNTFVYIGANGGGVDPLLLVKWDDVNQKALYYLPTSKKKYSVLTLQQSPH